MINKDVFIVLSSLILLDAIFLIINKTENGFILGFSLLAGLLAGWGFTPYE
jgi:hypothetical protein